MTHRRTRFTPRFARSAGAAAVFGSVLAAAAAASVAGCFFSRGPSNAPVPPRPFELVVREARDESLWRAGADSAAARRVESTLRHFGRIERVERAGGAARAGRSPEEVDATYAVFNDSLLFRSDAPFRYAALMTRDTLSVRSMDEGPSSGGALDADRAMLACIFEHPALTVSAGENDGPAGIVDLKRGCAGGLYRRLNLPATLGVFVVRVPPGRGRPGARWETVRTCPGFSGLAASLEVNFSFAVVETARGDGGAAGIDVSCDTTLTNVRTATPSGDPVDIVSHRIRVRGRLHTWEDLPLFHTGEISIEEDVRYARPDLESPVLEKRCRTGIVLTPR